MKTIVIAGAHSGVGKTTLARKLVALLPSAVFVKIGHHPENPSNPDILYPMGTPFEEIHRRHGAAGYLVLESNSILGELTPDCVFYLPADSPKPSALMAREKADVIRGEPISPGKVSELAGRLGLNTTMTRRIVWLAGARPSPVSAIVLAGGRSSRMGEDKALLDVNGEPLVERLRRQLRPFFDEIILSTGTRQIACSGMRAVADAMPDRGPLSGIHAGLSASETDHNFVVACDIPDIDHATIRALASMADQYDIVVPSFADDRPEPLYAFYRKSVAAAAEAAMRRGDLRVRGVFAACRTHVVKISGASWYRNLNTPDEYRCYTTPRVPGELGGSP